MLEKRQSKDQLRARHRLGKFLLRQGRRAPTGIRAWTQQQLKWCFIWIRVALVVVPIRRARMQTIVGSVTMDSHRTTSVSKSVPPLAECGDSNTPSGKALAGVNARESP